MLFLALFRVLARVSPLPYPAINAIDVRRLDRLPANGAAPFKLEFAMFLTPCGIFALVAFGTRGSCLFLTLAPLALRFTRGTYLALSASWTRRAMMAACADMMLFEIEIRFPIFFLFLFRVAFSRHYEPPSSFS